MVFEYFVSFSYSRAANAIGFGNANLFFQEEITSMVQIMAGQAYIAGMGDYGTVFIGNYQLLSHRTAPANAVVLAAH